MRAFSGSTPLARSGCVWEVLGSSRSKTMLLAGGDGLELQTIASRLNVCEQSQDASGPAPDGASPFESNSFCDLLFLVLVTASAATAAEAAASAAATAAASTAAAAAAATRSFRPGLINIQHSALEVHTIDLLDGRLRLAL